MALRASDHLPHAKTKSAWLTKYFQDCFLSHISSLLCLCDYSHNQSFFPFFFFVHPQLLSGSNWNVIPTDREAHLHSLCYRWCRAAQDAFAAKRCEECRTVFVKCFTPPPAGEYTQRTVTPTWRVNCGLLPALCHRCIANLHYFVHSDILFWHRSNVRTVKRFVVLTLPSTWNIKQNLGFCLSTSEYRVAWLLVIMDLYGSLFVSDWKCMNSVWL